MVEEAAGLCVQHGDCRHVLRTEFDIEDVDVLLDPFLETSAIAGVWDCDRLLTDPA